jgi:protein-S-isoprenylcysteine O-methyltransferase Ste14
MNDQTKTEQKDEFKEYRRGKIHFILLHSYLIFLLAVILGVFFDTFYNIRIFSHDIYQYIGLLLLIISSIIIYWAQSTSSNYKQREKKNESDSYFEYGPYKYLRSPTHFGLFIMALGLALIINSLFSVIFTIIAYLITKFFFLKKEEELLAKKYGVTYIEYKKKVKNWI